MVVIIECMKFRILKWFGHVVNMSEKGYVKGIYKETIYFMYRGLHCYYKLS